MCEACEEVMRSEGLALVLRHLLAIGNIMNEGAKGGAMAGGITLDSLFTLIHTKGSDRKTTVRTKWLGNGGRGSGSGSGWNGEV